MKIWNFSLCRNEIEILPFFLRHYSAFCERILVWDDNSTDGSREILQSNPKVTMYDWPHPDSGIDEDLFLTFARNTYPMACGNADFACWTDLDEMIYSPDIEGVLSECKDVDVVKTSGFNMMGNGLPNDDGRQIWETSPMGVRAPVYSKPVVFRPCANIVWNRGKHALENESKLRVTSTPKLKLLHYRYMGDEYTRKRNLKNFDRVGLKTGDKSAAWSCNPNWTGEHSPQWALKSIPLSYNVLEAPLP